MNVEGTRNIIDALQHAPDTSEKLLLYCSSAAVQLPPPLLMRLGHNFIDYASTYTLSDDKPIPEDHKAKHDYVVSKTEADRLVRAANGQRGLRTGVVSD